MFFLILTFCTSAAMDDCQVESFGPHENLRQCQVMMDVQRQVLGGERENNYRLVCEYWDGGEG